MSKRIKLTTFQPYLWLVLYALLNLFTSGKYTFALAAWVSPIIGLHFLYHNSNGSQRVRRGFGHFYLATWITLSIAWLGATPIWGLAHYGFMAVTALLGSLPFLADRLIAPRLAKNGRVPFIATLVFPAAATAMEFLTVSGNPIGNFGATGYSQAGLPVFMQITSVTGMLGLTFLMGWVAAVVNWAWNEGFSWDRVRGGVLALAAVLAAVLVFGSARMMTAPTPEQTVSIASFTLEEIDMHELNSLLESDPAAFRARTTATHAAYLARTVTAAQAGAKIVLWPELAGMGVDEDVKALIAQGQAVAKEQGIYLAMPAMHLFPDTERKAENKLYMADPTGQIVLEHTKFGGNMVEGTLAGDGILRTVETPYGTLSAVICWDTDFPNTIRQAGQMGVDILLSPAKEWEGIDPMHAHMATFRAVENGMAVVRQADEGLSMVTDAYGRTLATAHAHDPDGNAMLVAVPIAGTTTLYAQIGDVIGLISVALFLVLAAWAIVASRRQRRSTVNTIATTA